MDQHQQVTWHSNHHRLQNLTLDIKQLGFSAWHPFPPDSSTLIFNWNAKWNWKEHFAPLSSSPFGFLLSPGKALLILLLLQEWLDFINVTVVAHFLKTSVHDGFWCTDISMSLLFMKLSQLLFLNRLFFFFYPCCLRTFSYHIFPPPVNFILYASIHYSVNSQPF